MTTAGATSMPAERPDDHHAAYREAGRARRYHALVSAEDVDGRLDREVAALVTRFGPRALDIGAGTGRVTGLLVDAGASVVAVEVAPHMLAVLREAFAAQVDARQGDARELPCEDGAFDIAIAGWVFGHFRSWHPDTWRDEVHAAIDEMKRCLRPGGAAVIIETLGTGTPTPRVKDAHRQYLDALERAGFTQVATLRTDYAFASASEAVQTMDDFFGDRGQRWVAEFGHERIPECTGIWTLTATGR